jgi:hypothetical protein
MGLTQNLGRISTGLTADASLNIGVGVTPSGTYKFQVNGALGGTSATFSSSITSTLSSGIFLNNGSAGTNASQIRINNTSGDARFGIESSTGGTIQVGTSPYAVVLGNQANNPLQFTTNGTTRMTVTSGGDVGIGITTPTVAGSGYTGLEIKSSVSGASIILTNINNDRTYLYSGGANSDFLIENGGAQIFRAGLSERMRITSSGNVGIGTASPAVAGGSYTGLDIRGSGGASLVLGSTSTLFSYVYADAGALTLQTTSSIPISFIPGGAERMRINASGNVGIGTASPTGRLMLYQSSAGNVLQNIVSNQGGSTQVGINLSPSMTDAEVASNPAQASIYATDSNYGANIIFATKLTGAVGNSLTERMRITSGGLLQLNSSNSTGIRFAGGGSNLNYYEEGTFTPSNLNSNMSSVSVNFGRYVRIGSQVTINISWSVNPGGTGQKYLVFNLPIAFNIASGVSYTGAVSNYNSGTSSSSSNVGTSVRNSGSSDTQQYVEAVFTTNSVTTMLFSMTYFTF